MSNPYYKLLEYLLPEGILDYFEITHTVDSSADIHIYLQEKNTIPEKHRNYKLVSKGF